MCAYVCAGLQKRSTIASLTLPVHKVFNLTQVKFIYNNTEDVPGCFPYSIGVLTLISENWPENQSPQVLMLALKLTSSVGSVATYSP